MSTSNITDGVYIKLSTGVVQHGTVSVTSNVGIGTTIPSQKLEIQGTVKATSFAGDGSQLTNLPVSGGWQVSSTYTSDLYYTIGNVGIGTTLPKSILDINGIINSSTIDTPLLRINRGSDNAPTVMTINSDGNNYLNIANYSGNRGIYFNTYRGAGNNSILYIGSDGTNATNYGKVEVLNNATLFSGTGGITVGQSYAGIYPPPNGVIVNGNIGIGTTLPASKLHVVGSIRTSTNSTNYVVGTGIAVVVNSATPTTVASVTITTVGKPVLVMCSGDLQPYSAGTSDWCNLRFYRDSTAIGNLCIYHPGTATSTNQVFAQHVIDVPTEGTYTYTLKAFQGSGSIQFGEAGVPYITAIEFL